MALDGKHVAFYLSGAATTGGPSSPPMSLGGKRAGTRLDQLEGTLTVGQSRRARFVDANAVGGGSIDEDKGAYASSANLRHWFRFGADPSDIGRDYGNAARLLDLMSGAVNVSAEDLVEDVPLEYEAQGSSVDLNGTDEYLGEATEGALGIANAWTIGLRVLPLSQAVTSARLFALTSTGGNHNGVLLRNLSSGDEDVQILLWDQGEVQFKRYDYVGVLTMGTHHALHVTWDGSALQLYVDGAPATPNGTPIDLAGTQVDSDRRIRVGANINGEKHYPGRYTALEVWDVALSAAEVAEVATLGDGPRDHSGKWIAFVNGAAALHASRVAGFDPATGAYDLDEPTPALAAMGDAYRVFKPGNLFAAVDADEAALGATKHRMVYVRNETGVTLTALRAYFRLLDPCDTRWRLASDDAVTGDAHDHPTVADEGDEPDLSPFGGGARLLPTLTYAASSDQGTGNLSGNASRATWISRETAAGHRARKSCAVQLVVEGTNSGGDPDPISSSALVVFPVAGFTPQLTVSRDRRTRVGGGGRIAAEVRASESGLPVPNQAVAWELDGPGTLDAQEGATGADGRHAVAYAAPSDPAQEGQAVTFRARV